MYENEYFDAVGGLLLGNDELELKLFAVDAEVGDEGSSAFFVFVELAFEPLDQVSSWIWFVVEVLTLDEEQFDDWFGLAFEISSDDIDTVLNVLVNVEYSCDDALLLFAFAFKSCLKALPGPFDKDDPVFSLLAI